MTIDLNALKTEVTTDPLTLGYTGDDRNDAQILNNGGLRQVPKTVAIKDVLNFLSMQINGSGAALRYTLDMLREYAEAGTVRGASAGESGPEARRSAAHMILTMLRIGGDGSFEVSDSNIQTAFQSLEGVGSPEILTTAQLTGLAALAKQTGSRAQELFGEGVTTSEIAKARLV